MKINVKTHGIRFPEGGTNAEREQAYHIAVNLWWRTAQAIADAHGVGDIYQDGRSGGWLVAPDAEDFEAAIKAHLHRAPDIFGEALDEVRGIRAKAIAAANAYSPPTPPEGFEYAGTNVTTTGYITITYRPLP